MEKYVKLSEVTVDVTKYINNQIKYLESLIRNKHFIIEGEFDKELLRRYQREIYGAIDMAHACGFINIDTWSDLRDKAHMLYRKRELIMILSEEEV